MRWLGWPAPGQLRSAVRASATAASDACTAIVKKNETGGGSHIVRHGPCFPGEANDEHRARENRKAHFPVVQDPRESQQRNRQQRSAVELPRPSQLIPGAAGGPAQGTVSLEPP